MLNKNYASSLMIGSKYLLYDTNEIINSIAKQMEQIQNIQVWIGEMILKCTSNIKRRKKVFYGYYLLLVNNFDKLI